MLGGLLVCQTAVSIRDDIRPRTGPQAETGSLDRDCGVGFDAVRQPHAGADDRVVADTVSPPRIVALA